MPATLTPSTQKLRWMRGPARLQDGHVIMQIEGFGEEYDADFSQGIDVELAHIHEPADALGFVQRFGLLTAGRYHEMALEMPGLATLGGALEGWFEPPPSADPSTIVPPQRDPLVEAKEPYEHFVQTAAKFREILDVIKAVRNAHEGDSAARESLVDWFREQAERALARSVTTHPEFFQKNEEAMRLGFETQIASVSAAQTFLKHVTHVIAGMLNEGLNGDSGTTLTGVLGPRLNPEDPRESPDRLQNTIAPATLKAFCYSNLAQKLITRAPIVQCPECAHDFIRAHAAQEFCTRNCARRARYRQTRGAGQPARPAEAS